MHSVRRLTWQQPLKLHSSIRIPRLIYESATHAVQMPVYRRDGLSVGSQLSGPAIIEEIDSTTFIPSGTELHLDENYNLILTLAQEG